MQLGTEMNQSEILTGTSRGVVTGGTCPFVPNSEHIRTNIQKIFYKFVALKELYSLLNIQLKSKCE